MIIEIQSLENKLLLKGNPKGTLGLFLMLSILFFVPSFIGFYMASVKSPKMLEPSNPQFVLTLLLFIGLPVICIGALFFTLGKQFSEMTFDRQTQTVSLLRQGIFGAQRETFELGKIEGFRQIYVPPKGRQGKRWQFEMLLKNSESRQLALLWEEANAVGTVSAANGFLRS